MKSLVSHIHYTYLDLTILPPQ